MIDLADFAESFVAVFDVPALAQPGESVSKEDFQQYLASNPEGLGPQFLAVNLAIDLSASVNVAVKGETFLAFVEGRGPDLGALTACAHSAWMHRQSRIADELPTPAPSKRYTFNPNL